MKEDSKLSSIFDTITDEEEVPEVVQEIRQYLSEGEDPNAPNRLGYPPLMQLASHWVDLSEVLNILVSSGADVNATYNGVNHSGPCISDVGS